jgi:hypothetical protein
MREVESASIRIAERHGNDEFAVCPSRLSSKPKVWFPVSSAFTLLIIYRCALREILAWYGIDLSLSAGDWQLNLRPKSLVEESLQSMSTVAIPTRLDPAFDPRRTANLSRMVEQWGLVPLAYLAKLSSDKFTYGYAGSEDFTMYPLLPLKMAEPGEALGLSAVISGTPYELTAETAGPCQVNFIDRDALMRSIPSS